jgi:hypothetical protein
MSSVKISEPAELRARIGTSGDDPFEAIACLHFKGAQHAVSGLTHRDNEGPSECIEVIKVFADAQDTAVALNVPFKCAVDGRLGQSAIKQVACGGAHVQKEGVAIGREKLGHAQALYKAQVCISFELCRITDIKGAIYRFFGMMRIMQPVSLRRL